MKSLKRQCALLLAVLLVISLAGCGSTPAAQEPAQAATQASTASGSSNEGSSKGPTVSHVSSPEMLTNVAPFAGSQVSRMLVLYGVYQPLVERNKETGELIKVLLSDIKNVDDFTYRCTLYDNIVDSAGNPFKASDAVFSITACKEAGNVSGMKYVKEAKVVSDYVFDVVMTRNADYQFGASMAMIFMVTEASYKASADQMATGPVGTGPYVLDKWVSGSSATIKKQDKYWGAGLADKAKNPAWYWHAQNVDIVEFTKIGEAAQASIALETGKIDIAQLMTQKEAERFMKNKDYTVWQETDTLSFNLFFNAGDKSPCGNQQLRQAICYAIDAAGCMEATGGYGLLNSTFGSAKFNDCNPEWSKEDYYNYNLDKAKELLKQSGFDTSKELVMMVANISEDRAVVAQTVQAYLLEIGINVKIETYDGASFGANKYDETKYDIKLDVSTYECLADLWTQFLSNEGHKDGKNYAFVKDDKLQALLDGCTLSTNHTPENMNLAHQYIKDMAYCYGLYSKEDFDVTSTKVTDLVRHCKLYVMPGACTYN
jgi:ABC-type transport system substrate-binding protein